MCNNVRRQTQQIIMLWRHQPTKQTKQIYLQSTNKGDLSNLEMTLTQYKREHVWRIGNPYFKNYSKEHVWRIGNPYSKKLFKFPNWLPFYNYNNLKCSTGKFIVFVEQSFPCSDVHVKLFVLSINFVWLGLEMRTEETLFSKQEHLRAPTNQTVAHVYQLSLTPSFSKRKLKVDLVLGKGTPPLSSVDCNTNPHYIGMVAWSVTCQPRKQWTCDRSSHLTHSFMDNYFPLLLIHKKLIVNYMWKNGHLIQVNCL